MRWVRTAASLEHLEPLEKNRAWQLDHGAGKAFRGFGRAVDLGVRADWGAGAGVWERTQDGAGGSGGGMDVIASGGRRNGPAGRRSVLPWCNSAG